MIRLFHYAAALHEPQLNRGAGRSVVTSSHFCMP